MTGQYGWKTNYADIAILLVRLGFVTTQMGHAVSAAVVLRSVPCCYSSRLALAAAVAILLTVAGIAAYLPARRASLIRPMDAVRAD